VARRFRMKAIFKRAVPYQDDEMNLPVKDVEAAIPFYEKIMGFQVVSRGDSPFKSAILGRDGIQIGLAENGGDPTQDGCFFEVDDVDAAFGLLANSGRMAWRRRMPITGLTGMDRPRTRSFSL